MDNLPVAIAKTIDSGAAALKVLEKGFPVGFVTVCIAIHRRHACHPLCHTIPTQQEDGRTFVHNHLRFTLLYHVGAEDDLARIVGFEVEPFSVQHKYEGTWSDGQGTPALSTCNPGAMKYVSDKDGPQEIREPEDDKMGDEVIFTYDVAFKVWLA